LNELQKTKEEYKQKVGPASVLILPGEDATKLSAELLLSRSNHFT
jgi:hypothetical protein